jgi:AAA15 family ATPase/GTPase
MDNLKDLNIIIGPNNCGKSSILEMIELLNQLEPSDHAFKCPDCGLITRTTGQQGLSMSFNPQVKHLRKKKIELTFILDKNEVERLFNPEALQAILKPFLTLPDHSDVKLILSEGKSQRLYSDHIFPYDISEVKTQLLSVLKCPEERLQLYKGKDITAYIRDQSIRADIMLKWISNAQEICDPKIETYNTNTLDFVRKIGNENFISPITEQGSGVRSLICLMADILSKETSRIILIDEPELGLNPAAKQALIRFLLHEIKNRQIFLATHDPTFVNPILLQKDKVALYMFSPIEDGLVEIDLNENQQDPNTFGGYLPHTASLKKIHLYVEGKTDVYTFQIFLRKFLIDEYPKDWCSKLNQVGIFHLAGSFWCHLLYTIPQTPYSSLVILDGDKRKTVDDVVKKLNESIRLPERVGRFKVCSKRTQLKHRGRPMEIMPTPIYCLEKDEIEDYIDPKPKTKDEGPINAEKMSRAPPEIIDIFRSLPFQ